MKPNAIMMMLGGLLLIILAPRNVLSGTNLIRQVPGLCWRTLTVLICGGVHQRHADRAAHVARKLPFALALDGMHVFWLPGVRRIVAANSIVAISTHLLCCRSGVRHKLSVGPS